MLCVIDLDGTLADPRQRLAKAGVEPDVKDPVKYQQWLDALQAPGSLLEDPVITHVAEVVRQLHASGTHTIVYLTGRSELYRSETQQWLSRHGLPNEPIIMRRADEYNSAREYKQSAMRVLREIYFGDGGILVIDDDPAGDCSKMYQEIGAVHLKVMGGAYV